MLTSKEIHHNHLTVGYRSGECRPLSHPGCSDGHPGSDPGGWTQTGVRQLVFHTGGFNFNILAFRQHSFLFKWADVCKMAVAAV